MKRLWRVAAGLSLAHVVLMLGGFSLQKVSAFGADNATVLSAYQTGSQNKVYAGEFIALIAFLLFLVVTSLIARLVRGANETSKWLAGAALATGVAYVAVNIGAAFVTSAAAGYGARHGGDTGAIVAVNNIHNFADFVGMGTLGAFTLLVGATLFAGRALPRWIAWLSLPVGVFCLAGGLVPADLVNQATLVWIVWFVALAVAMIRQAPRSVVADSPVSPALIGSTR